MSNKRKRGILNSNSLSNTKATSRFGSSNMKLIPSPKRSQLTIFIILAIVLVLVIMLLFLFKDSILPSTIPKNIEPVYDYYKSCIESETKTGAFILGQQAGYINPPEFTPGSEYMPFSNYLNFLGTGVPYWYYISGNNVKKNQMPSKEKMQEELNTFLQERLQDCNFQKFEQMGYSITYSIPQVKTSIKENSITTDVSHQLTISFENQTWTKKTHSTKTNTNLGKFYNLAKKIYEDNEQTMFLENYAVDILRLYAPVDGSELTCSSKIWQTNQVRQDLINALEVNIPQTKIKGNYYTLSKPQNKYFIHDIGENINTNINFAFSSQWPVKIEVWPNEGEIMKADPIGLQQGLGTLGFCYVPYHFVYDFAYPVLIQVYSDEEMFQFPVVVSLDKNTPRQSVDAESLPNTIPELCQNKITQLSISTYNTDLNPVNTNINFKCFDTSCPIGQTEAGKLTANFPQCANGYIIASAEGYETAKQIITTIEPSSATIILDKKYTLDLELTKGTSQLQSDEYAIISLNKINPLTNEVQTSQTYAYPEQKQITITEGTYKIKTYVYSDSTITLESSTMQKCTQIPKTGILGVFGATEEKCFTINIPEQIASSAVSGGGTQEYFITEQELKNSDTLSINTPFFPKPTSPEQLQTNYNNIEINSLDINLE